jgi:nucleoside-diphosphate-sugar epimerase
MRSDDEKPFNLGTDELVTVNQLVDTVAAAAGKRVVKRHNLTKPQGVRGRNSDNSRLRSVLDWEPKTSLQQGIVPTYRWIQQQVGTKAGIREPAVAK